MKQTNESAPLRFRLVPTVDGGTRLVRVAAEAVQNAPTGQGGGFPMWARLPHVERRPAAAILRDVADSIAAARAFN